MQTLHTFFPKLYNQQLGHDLYLYWRNHTFKRHTHTCKKKFNLGFSFGLIQSYRHYCNGFVLAKGKTLYQINFANVCYKNLPLYRWNGNYNFCVLPDLSFF